MTTDDLLDRYAQAAADWALMYPIAAWIGDGPRAERLAKRWGEQIARFLDEEVRDAELERLRQRAEQAEARLKDAELELADWRLARSRLGRWWEWPLVQWWWYRQYKRADRRAFRRECEEIQARAKEGGE